jgi:hypothetical protein
MKIQTVLNKAPNRAVDNIVRIARIDKDNVEYDYASECGKYSGRFADIKDFRYRTHENVDKFTAVMIIPTGIDCAIGGHAGDAGAFAQLIGAACDTLVLHPNVVNASDINYMPDNALYVEGSTITRLLGGTISLRRVRSNKIAVIIDDSCSEIEKNIIANAVNAAVVTYGASIVRGDPFPFEISGHLYSNYSVSPNGRATAVIDGVAHICNEIDRRNLLDYADAFAIITHIGVELDDYDNYFKSGDNINPWGGAEAMLTHTMSLIYNRPFAHAPIDYRQFHDIVDPRKAAEAVPTTHIQCILRGLQRSPRIDIDGWAGGDVSTEDISCLIIPDGCAGPPVDAAVIQGIPIIVVKENKNLMKNDLASLGYNKMYFVENYLEAVGIMVMLKEGLTYKSVRRPIYALQGKEKG